MVGAKTKVVLSMIKSGKSAKEAVSTVFKPKPSTQPSTSTSVTPVETEDQKIINEALESTTGKSFYLEYRTPSGEVKRTITDNPAQTIKDIQGEFMSLREHSPHGGPGSVYTYQKGDIIYSFDISKEVLSRPSEKERYISSQYNIPGYVKEQITLPSEYSYLPDWVQKDIEHRIEEISYERYLGMDVNEQEKAVSKIISIYQPTPAPLSYDEQLRQWKKESWTELGKQEYGGLKQAVQAFTGAYVNIYDPNYWEAFYKGKGSEYLYSKEYQITEQMKSGDVKGAWWTAAAPAYENIVIPLSFGVAMKYVGEGQKLVESGKASKFGTLGYKYVVPPAKVISGGATTVLIGGELGITAAQHKEETLGGWGSSSFIKKVGTLGLQFSMMGVGYEYYTPGKSIGFKPGIIKTKYFLNEKLPNVYGKVQNVYSKINKLEIKNYFKPKPEFTFKQQVSHALTKAEHRLIIPEKITGKINTEWTRFRTLSGYKPKELKLLPYKSKQWIRPEEIVFMPKHVKTKTFITINPKTPFKSSFYSLGENKSFKSYGEIKTKNIDDISSTGIGQQSEIIGTTMYKTYDKNSVIPNIYKKAFSGIVRSKEIKTNKISSDIIGIETTGSFKELKTPTNEPFAGFGGRLFNEDIFSKSLSYSKQFGESKAVPGKYGFKTIETPDITYSISKGEFIGKNYGYYSDTAVIYKPKIQGKEYFGSSMGFDYGVLKEITKQNIVSMPGGLNTKQVSDIELLRISPKMHQTRNLFVEDYITENISSYWQKSLPSNKPILNIYSKIELIPLSNLKQNQFNINLLDIKTEIKPMNITSTNNSSKILTQQESMQNTIQNQITKQNTQQSQLTKQLTNQLTIQKPLTNTLTTELSTEYTYTPTKIITTPKITTTSKPSIKIPKIKISSINKKIMKEQLKTLGIGYRFRKWKTPRISDVLKIKGW